MFYFFSLKVELQIPHSCISVDLVLEGGYVFDSEGRTSAGLFGALGLDARHVVELSLLLGVESRESDIIGVIDVPKRRGVKYIICEGNDKIEGMICGRK